MPTPSVYSPAMQMNAPPALLQRIGRLLRAKESLVFYAIGLGLLDFAAPLATGWLFRHRSLATLLRTDNSVAGDAVAGHAAAVVAVAVAYLAAVGLLHRRLPALAARTPALGAARRPPVRAALRAARADRRRISWGLARPCRAGCSLDDATLAAVRVRRADDRQRAAALRRVRDRGEQRRAGAALVALAAGVRRQRRSSRCSCSTACSWSRFCSGSSCPATRARALSLAPTCSSTCSSGAASASSPTWCCSACTSTRSSGVHFLRTDRKGGPWHSSRQSTELERGVERQIVLQVGPLVGHRREAEPPLRVVRQPSAPGRSASCRSTRRRGCCAGLTRGATCSSRASRSPTSATRPSPWPSPRAPGIGGCATRWSGPPP